MNPKVGTEQAAETIPVEDSSDIHGWWNSQLKLKLDLEQNYVKA